MFIGNESSSRNNLPFKEEIVLVILFWYYKQKNHKFKEYFITFKIDNQQKSEDFELRCSSQEQKIDELKNEIEKLKVTIYFCKNF
jgi:hypothetical protein